MSNSVAPLCPRTHRRCETFKLTPRFGLRATVTRHKSVRNVADADRVHRGGHDGRRRLGPEGRADHPGDGDEEAAAGEAGARRQAAPLRAQDPDVPEQ